MPRANRHDGPDTWHHLLNRGVAKRTIFETAADCRFFLSLRYRRNVVRWTMRKARLADGTRPWRPVCPARAVRRVLETTKNLVSLLQATVPAGISRARAGLTAGLLRMLSGCTHREIARHLKRHHGTIAHDIHDQLQWIQERSAYAELVSRLARRALALAGV